MLRNQVLSIVDLINTYLIALLVFLLPFFFLPFTTDSLELPKQLLVIALTLILLVLFGLKGVLEKRFSFRRSPFDVGLALLFLVILVSAIFSPSKSPTMLLSPTSIVAGVPLLALILLYFLIVNSVVAEKRERLIVGSLLVSGSLLALFTVLQFLKIYILPYPGAQVPGFSLAGSLLGSTILFFSLLPLGVLSVRAHLRRSQEDLVSGFFLATTVIIAIGAAIGLYQLVTTAKPLLLSQETGLRTAVQPLGLNFQTALFGTGPGTYLFNFTRFKDVAINNTNLWSLRFTNSSSFFLEMLSTLGILGVLSFLFIVFRIVSSFFKSPAHDIRTIGTFLSLLLAIILAFFLPFSLVSTFLFFLLLALFAIRLGNQNHKSVFDVTVSIVALKKGLISLERGEGATHGHGSTDILPYILLGVFLIVGGFVGYHGYNFLLSDLTLQRGLIAFSQNLPQETYDLQNRAITIFPQRDAYHRVFSQTNLALANGIASSAKPATPEDPTGGLTTGDRNTIIRLAQDSINFSRNAAILSPLNVVNWENLTSIYRGLIGFAQSADQFAIAAAQQAVLLDPNNPLVYITLGGVYYQLGQYDGAIQAFAKAPQLKPDFANAHYNLGHAFEVKGDPPNLKAALEQYQIVRNLVARDSDDFKRIDSEITALEIKMGIRPPAKAAEPAQGEELKVDEPEETLPEQKPPVELKDASPPATPEAKPR